ncbi:Retinoblastoma-binding protein 5 [Bienertia sinuspersici]
MEMVPFKLFAPVVLAALILVLSTTTASCEEMRNMYVIEEVAVVEPKAKIVNIGNQKPKMMIMQVADQDKQASVATTTASSASTQSGLSCANEGEYCNTLFGTNCCSGIACVQAPLGGGICHKW